MLQRLMNVLTRAGARSSTSIQFEKAGDGWLKDHLADAIVAEPTADDALIAKLAAATNEQGPVALWSGYGEVEDYPRDTTGSRRASEVSSPAQIGRFFARLVIERRPSVIVEFGTAFGVSGMHWLAGLKAADNGMLFTFEPNQAWAELADRNLAAISDRYQLTIGTFEENADRVLEGLGVDLAFIDAIHTGAFVFAQYAILLRFLMPGALVVFDDIDFSDDMRDCWKAIAAGPEVAASARIGKRVGIIELLGR